MAFNNSRWSTYYRAIYCVGPDNDEPRLSGLACYSEQDEIHFLPPEAHQRFDDLHLESLSLITIQDAYPPGPKTPESEKEKYAWGFRFHDSCWKLAEQACSPRPVDLKVLWRILRSVPHSAELPFWGHNFGGLYTRARRAHDAGNHFASLREFSNLMIPSAYYDPFTIPELRHRLAQTRIRVDDAAPAEETPQTVAILPAAPGSSDPFLVLPIELREMILTYVATADMLSFRLASRVMATTPFSQYFFQSRFWACHEMGVLFDGFLADASERAGIDWRNLYQLSKERIKCNMVGLGERNRLRIWKQTVWPLTQAISRVSRLSELKGKSDWLQEFKGVSEPPSKSMPWKSVETAQGFNPEQFGKLRRRVCEAEIEIPPSKLAAIHVSLIEFFGTKFISGLAFETEHGEDIEIGYIIPGSEEPVIVEAILEGLHIAVDECGFRAISPHTNQHMHSEHLDWIGDRGDLPIRILRRGGHGIRKVRAIFDGFRMQALYIPKYGDES